MNEYQRALFNEHFELVYKLRKLEDYINSKKSDNDDRIEFANKCLQLNGMKCYEKALRARLYDANVVIGADGEYFIKMATPNPNDGMFAQNCKSCEDIKENKDSVDCECCKQK